MAKPDPSVSPNDIKWDEVGISAYLGDADILIRPQEGWPTNFQWSVRLHKDIGMWGANCKTAEQAKSEAITAYHMLKRYFLPEIK